MMEDIPPPVVESVAAIPSPAEAVIADLPKEDLPTKELQADKSNPLSDKVFSGTETVPTPSVADGHDNSLVLANWWLSTRWANRYVRDNKNFSCYLNPVRFGINRETYDYVDDSSQKAVRYKFFPAGTGWDVTTDGYLPRTGYDLQTAIKESLTSDSKDLRVITALTRTRGLVLDGTTATRLAQTVNGILGTSSGSSTFINIARLMGYILSVTLPADSGFYLPASIPANSPISCGKKWFPGTGDQSITVPNIKAVLITALTYVNFLTGYATIADLKLSDLGITIIPVTIKMEWISGSGLDILWLLSSFLTYPMKHFQRTGLMSDKNGGLLVNSSETETPNWVNWACNWVPGPNLTRIWGPRASTTSPPIVFLLIAGGVYPETTAAATGVKITFPGDVELPLKQNPIVETDLVSIGAPLGVIFPLGANVVLQQLPHMIVAMDWLFGFFDGSNVYDDVVKFWASAGTMVVPAGEEAASASPLLPAPAFSNNRGWAPDVTTSLAVCKNSVATIPTNALRMPPSVTVDATGNWTAAQMTDVHWYVPLMDPVIMSLRLMGIVSPVVMSGPVSAPRPIAMTASVMELGWSVVKASSLLSVARGVTRRNSWVALSSTEPALEVKKSLLRAHSAAIWGLAGDVWMAEKSYTLQRIWFSRYYKGQVAPLFPFKGVILEFTPTVSTPFGALPLWLAAPGEQFAANIQVRLLPESTGIPLPSSTTCNWSDLFAPDRVVRDPTMVRDNLYCPLPAITGVDTWDKAWKIATAISNLTSYTNQSEFLTVFGMLERMRNTVVRWTCPLDHLFQWSILLSMGSWSTIQVYASITPNKEVLALPVPPAAVDIVEQSTRWLVTSNRPLAASDGLPTDWRLKWEGTVLTEPWGNFSPVESVSTFSQPSGW